MNYAILVSGGMGSRMKNATLPKQYIEVEGKPVFLYSLEKLFACADIGAAVIVAAGKWHSVIGKYISGLCPEKPFWFADAGGSRQESVLHGLEACIAHGGGQGDRVLIHDAARPLVSAELIARCLELPAEYGGVMPVLPMTDTAYVSADRSEITGLLDRDSLFCGQSPECFELSAYYALHRGLDAAELAAVHGSSEIAFRSGMRIKMIAGEPTNFKITTDEDLYRFASIVRGRSV